MPARRRAETRVESDRRPHTLDPESSPSSPSLARERSAGAAVTSAATSSQGSTAAGGTHSSIVETLGSRSTPIPCLQTGSGIRIHWSLPLADWGTALATVYWPLHSLHLRVRVTVSGQPSLLHSPDSDLVVSTGSHGHCAHANAESQARPHRTNLERSAWLSSDEITYPALPCFRIIAPQPWPHNHLSPIPPQCAREEHTPRTRPALAPPRTRPMEPIWRPHACQRPAPIEYSIYRRQHASNRAGACEMGIE